MGRRLSKTRCYLIWSGTLLRCASSPHYRPRPTKLHQILDVDPEGEEDGANRDLDSMRKGKCAVIKTSTRQTVFLPLIGLVPAEKLKPGDLVGVNKDSYLVLDTLPAEFDSRAVRTVGGGYR